MIEQVNGKERTLKQVNELLEQTGWKVLRVHQVLTFGSSKVVAVPA